MTFPIHSIAAALAVAAPATPDLPQARDSEQPPGAASSSFNPQISIVTDFRGTLVDNREDKRWTLNEVEFGFAADVDPFLRAEAYIGIHQHVEEADGVGGDHSSYDVEIEEAFATYNRLGKGFQAKLGKIAAAVGRIQRNHPDQINWLDFPLVIQDLFGEDGLRAPGVHLSYLVPGSQFFELTAEAVQPDNGPLFSGSTLDKPVAVTRARTFFDFSDDLSAQLGSSFLIGPNGDARARVFGLDYTMKWRPGAKGKSASLEAEAYWSHSNAAGFGSTFGAFGAVTYEVAPRVFLTGRYDYSEMPGTPEIRQAWGANVTFRLTEFQHLRLEFMRLTSNFDDPRNVLTFQFQYLMGSHPAHKY